MKARSPPAYFEFSANRVLAESGTFKTFHHAFAPKSRAATAFFRIPKPAGLAASGHSDWTSIIRSAQTDPSRS
jgi:hypothetical protein